jgi:ribonucleotide monophosphatase NagD (HAD superfamily)
MVGDRLNTDIKWGKTSGISTLLVMTGVTTEEDLLNPDNDVHPDYILNSLGDLTGLLAEGN